MINSIATYKESLSRIANEVFDAAEELEISPSRDGSREDSPASGRRFSQRSTRFASPVAGFPIANGVGTDPGSNDEVRVNFDQFMKNCLRIISMRLHVTKCFIWTWNFGCKIGSRAMRELVITFLPLFWGLSMNSVKIEGSINIYLVLSNKEV